MNTKSTRRSAAAVLLVLAGLTYMRQCTFEQRPFDAEAWRQGDDVERGEMARDLAASKHLIGRSPEEVARILGEPFAEFNGVMIYRVKMAFRAGFDFPGSSFGVELSGDPPRVVNLRLEDD